MTKKPGKLPDYTKLEIAVPSTEIAHLAEFDRSSNMSVEAIALNITDQKSFDQASEMLAQARGIQDMLKKEEGEFRKPYNEALKKVSGWFAPAKESLERVISTLNKKMSDYVVAERRERERLQRIADEEARKERERLAKAAQRAEAKGQEEKAQDLQTQAVQVVPEVVPQKVTASKTTTVLVWKGRVKDKIAFVKAVAAGKVPDAMLDVNESKLNSIARQSEGGMDWDGIEWYQEAEFRRK